MIYRRETVKINPARSKEYDDYFHHFILPNQLKNGAKLVGRWKVKSQAEYVAIWEYPSFQEYLKIEERVVKDSLYKQGEEQLNTLGYVIKEKQEDFLTATGDYYQPKHSVSVSGYITNDQGEVLLVKTFWRTDTWELPGGGVDEGETLDEALKREILEETGIEVQLKGVTGVYSNGNVVAVVFRGKSIGGSLQTSPETKEVRFVKIDTENLAQFITRPKFKPRVLDAMKGKMVPYESFSVRPYRLVERIDIDMEWPK